MQRYFAKITDDKVFLSKEDAHHFCHVMRGKLLEKIEAVIDNSTYLCEAISLSPLFFKIINEFDDNSELNRELTLICPLLKSDKNELVIQKGTEIGVTNFVFVNTKRCVVKIDQDAFNKRKKRYESIIKEASEQCHRKIVPSIDGLYNISTIPKKYLSGLNLVAYENLSKTIKPDFSLIKNAQSISYFFGPEGGFDEKEISFFKKENFQLISLGRRILRAETAAIYALSVISYLLEA